MSNQSQKEFFEPSLENLLLENPSRTSFTVIIIDIFMTYELEKRLRSVLSIYSVFDGAQGESVSEEGPFVPRLSRSDSPTLGLCHTAFPFTLLDNITLPAS